MNERDQEYYNLLRQQRDIKWRDKTTKEKLDFIFVCVAITTFSLGAIVHIRNLTRGK